MNHKLIERRTFSRSEVAQIIGMDDNLLSSWLKRHTPFPEQHQGKGRHIIFGLNETMKVAALQDLVAVGIPPGTAAAALRWPVEMFDEMLTRGRSILGQPASKYPGTIKLYVNSSKQWRPDPSPQSPIALDIHLWPIWDRVWPGIRKQINSAPGQISPDEIGAALTAFTARIEQIREKNWADQSTTTNDTT